MNANIKIFDNEGELYSNAAKDIIDIINVHININNRCTLVLSGGSTPDKLYDNIVSNFYNEVDWNRVFIFWGDERCVPPDDDESNYKAAKIHLLDKLPIPGQNIYRIPGELTPVLAAEKYESTLRKNFQESKLPSFDVLLLGIGKDGHIASLFPEGKAIMENNKWAIADYLKKLNSWRVTLTLPVINNSKNIILMASGAEKSAIINRIMNDKSSDFPAQKVIPAR